MRANLRFALAEFILCMVALGSVGCGAVLPKAPGPVEVDAFKQGTRNGDANGRQFQNNFDPSSWAQRLEGLRTSAAKIATNLSDINNQLSQVFAVKDALCSRQADLFTSCIVHTPLSPSSWRTGAACRSDRKVWDARNFVVQLRGIPGRFQIILDNSIYSTIFNAEKETQVQWSSRGNRSLKDLKLSDIGSIKMKAIEGTFADLPSASFTFKIDDKLLLTEKDLILSSRTSNAVAMNQLALTDELSSPQCRVEESEIDELQKNVLSRIKIPEPILPPQPKSELSNQLRSEQYEDWINSSRRDLQSKTDTYLAIAQDISRLRRDLRGELQLGCWSREVIRSIEVNFNGSHLPLSDWDRSATREPSSNSGSPTQTTLDFGGGLKFTNGDENTITLFKDDARWLINTNTDLTIGDINSIQLHKGGVAWQSIKNCWSTWGGLGTACEWQNREAERYKLEKLTLKINGQLAYQRDAIGLTLQRSSLDWIEKDLTSNPAYIDLMRRRDCPISADAK
ncbi:hypothetical protein EBU99_01730 [bacterium]|nr:hypothetical protein [bacterium]